MLGLAAGLQKGGSALLSYVTDNLKLYLDFKKGKHETLKFPCEGSTDFSGSGQYINCGTGCDTAPKENANKAISNFIFFIIETYLILFHQ